MAAVNSAGSRVPMASKGTAANTLPHMKKKASATITRKIIGVIIHFIHILLHGIVQRNVSQLIIRYL